jgi:site-specific recombinase XerD
MISTLHRPTTEPFGSLRNFDLHSGIVNIVDKGPYSFRIIPLSDAALALVIAYTRFLDSFSTQFRNIYSDISNPINLMLQGEIPLFQMLNSGTASFRPFKPNFLNKYQSSEVIKNNFARHYIPSFLAQGGASRDEIKIFLGHISGATKSVRFTSLDCNLLRAVVAQVETHIHLPTSDGGLDIKIPEQLK